MKSKLADNYTCRHPTGDQSCHSSEGQSRHPSGGWDLINKRFFWIPASAGMTE